MSKYKNNNKDTQKFGAKWTKESQAGNRTFYGWNNWKKERGFIKVLGSLDGEHGKSSAGDWVRGTATVLWLDHGSEQTATCFYYVNSNSVVIPKWNITLSLGKNFCG